MSPVLLRSLLVILLGCAFGITACGGTALAGKSASAKRSKKRLKKRRSKKRTRKKRRRRRIPRYYMSLRHVNTKERIRRLRVISVDPKNRDIQRVRKKARRRLTHFLRDWRKGKERHVPERLIWNLYRVAYHFDAPIEVVSGHRSTARKTSRHYVGRAIDFRVQGVDPKDVWAYCKRFGKVGLGWYPTSKFVHMDVRKQSFYWIDDSGPGQPARYRDGVAQTWRRWLKKKKRKRRGRRRSRRRRARLAHDTH